MHTQDLYPDSGSPLEPSMSLPNRLKALGLVALAGGVGVGLVVAARSIWNPDAEETLLPLAPTSGGEVTPDLRDRLLINTPRSMGVAPPTAIASPESTAVPSPPPRSRSTALRSSHGFQSPGGVAKETAEEAEEAAAEEAAADGDDGNAAPAAGAAPQGGAAASAPLPVAVIAALLQPPPPLRSSPNLSPESSDIAIAPSSLSPSLSPDLSPPTPSSTAPFSAPGSPPGLTPTDEPPRIIPVPPPLSPNVDEGASPVAPGIIPSAPSVPPVPETTPVVQADIPDETQAANSPASPTTSIPTRPNRPKNPTSTAPTPTLSGNNINPEPVVRPAPSAPGAATAIAPSSPSVTVPPLQPQVSVGTSASPSIPSGPNPSLDINQLKITGNTRFSQQELLALVRDVIVKSDEPISSNSPGSKPGLGLASGELSQSGEAVPKRDPCKDSIITRSSESMSSNSSTPKPGFGLTPAELVQASEAITKLYTCKGYISSGAYVPAEVLNGAVPEIRVVEGKLETVKVTVQRPKFLGLGRPLSPRYVQRRLTRAVKSPLQIDQLVDVVKLLEQDPVIDSVTTKLSPGTTTGGSVLDVTVKQSNPMQLSVSTDNGRSPSVGRLRQQINLSQAGLLTSGDRLQIGYNRSEGSSGWDFGYSLPINARNGTLSFNYGTSKGQVIEAPFQDLDIKSRSQSYEIALRQPLKQTSTEELALTLRGTHTRSNGVFLESFNAGTPLPFPARGSDADGNTRVTALRFGQEWLKRSPRDVISLQSEFSLGLNALGATVLDAAPDGRFFSWQGRGFWVHSFAPDTLFALKGQVQLADRPLVPTEQISIGGIDTVRGYRTSVLLADSGWFASAEAYLPILRIPKWQGVVQVVPFFDLGQGSNRGEDQPDPNRLMTLGLGLQMKLGEKFRARLDWGVPLINATTTGGRSQRESLFFSVVFTP